jgi:broad specificity phosphatase PhoE
MKLYITRHGETVENSMRIVQGHIGGSLSAKGQEQAKKNSA